MAVLARFSFVMRLLVALATVSVLSACSMFAPQDPVMVTVIGIEPLHGEDLELRMEVRLRVQNPNQEVVDFKGLVMELSLNGQPFASGVSRQQGRIEGYSEQTVTVPVSISALAILRQAYGMGRAVSFEGMPYRLQGKLATGPLGAVRFEEKGRLSMPDSEGM